MAFKVLVHNPAELPKISNYGFLVTAGREARIPINPVYQDAVPSIRNININVRKCLFSDEGNLLYYRTYSLKNCQIECEAKIIMDECKCILYYLPRIDPAIRICGPKDNFCTNNIQDKIESSDNNLSCSSCLPGCFELSYQSTLTSASISHGSFISATEFPNEPFENKESIANLSIMHFYYVSNTLRSTRKSEMFGLTEFISNTGGILSLFMGFSVFSLIEIIFYVTVRPYCARRALKKANRKIMNKQKKHFHNNIENFESPTTPIYRGLLNKNENYVKNRFQKSVNNILLQRDKTFNGRTQNYPYVN